MSEDLKVSQIGSSPLPPPFRGLHSPGVRKNCQIIFAWYFRKSSIMKKKSKPEKAKKTITLEKSTFTQREHKTKIQQNRKIIENKARKEAAKRQQNKHVRKMNFQDNLHK